MIKPHYCVPYRNSKPRRLRRSSLKDVLLRRQVCVFPRKVEVLLTEFKTDIYYLIGDGPGTLVKLVYSDFVNSCVPLNVAGGRASELEMGRGRNGLANRQLLEY